jgi:RNA polymerase sigma factor (sigma-70 family)
MGGSEQLDLDEHAKWLIRRKTRQIIGTCGFTQADYADLEQDLTLDLLVRLSKFDPSKAGLKTFVARVVDHKIANLTRHRRQQRRDYCREVCSLDDPIEDAEGGSITRGESVSKDEHDLRWGKHSRSEIDRIEMRLDISLAVSELPADLKLIAQHLMTSSITETARKLGVPRGTLYQTGIARLRKFFHDRGLAEYL